MAATYLKRFALVGLILSLLFVWLLLREPSLPTAPTSAEAARSFEEKINQLKQADGLGTSAEVRVTEAELNSRMEEAMKTPPPSSGPAALSAAKVSLGNPGLTTILTVNIKGVELYLTMEGNLNFSNHIVRLEPTTARIGSVPIPPSILKGKIDIEMDVPESVTAFRVENSQLVLRVR